MNKTLSNTEYQIMCYFWECQEERSFAQLMIHFQEEGRAWKKQTLNTFLTRLIQKNLLQFRKVGNKKFYSINMDKKAYEKFCAEEVLKDTYGGKLSRFLAALTGDDSLTEMDEQELLEHIKRK